MTSQRVVDTTNTELLISQGYRFARTLPNDKVVLQK